MGVSPGAFLFCRQSSRNGEAVTKASEMWRVGQEISVSKAHGRTSSKRSLGILGRLGLGKTESPARNDVIERGRPRWKETETWPVFNEYMHHLSLGQSSFYLAWLTLDQEHARLPEAAKSL